MALLTLPLNTYDPVTVLGLSTYPAVMSLLKPGTCKVWLFFTILSALQRALHASLPTGNENMLQQMWPSVDPTCWELAIHAEVAHLSHVFARQYPCGALHCTLQSCWSHAL